MEQTLPAPTCPLWLHEHAKSCETCMVELLTWRCHMETSLELSRLCRGAEADATSELSKSKWTWSSPTAHLESLLAYNEKYV